jgi:hypothetical protein
MSTPKLDDILSYADQLAEDVTKLRHLLQRHAIAVPLTDASSATPWADQLAVREQLITDLMQALGDICHAAEVEEVDLADLIAKGRHVLDNVRNHLPGPSE